MEKKEDISGLGTILDNELDLDHEGRYANMEDLLLAITQRVAQLLEQDAGLLFSYLYRLDVSEKQVQNILDPGWKEPTDLSIAQLILDRQLQRLHTRKTIIQPPIEGWEW